MMFSQVRMLRLIIPQATDHKMLYCSAPCLIMSSQTKRLWAKLVVTVVIIHNMGRDLYYIYIVGLPAHELGFREASITS